MYSADRATLRRTAKKAIQGSPCLTLHPPSEVWIWVRAFDDGDSSIWIMVTRLLPSLPGEDADYWRWRRHYAMPSSRDREEREAPVRLAEFLEPQCRRASVVLRGPALALNLTHRSAATVDPQHVQRSIEFHVLSERSTSTAGSDQQCDWFKPTARR